MIPVNHFSSSSTANNSTPVPKISGVAVGELECLLNKSETIKSESKLDETEMPKRTDCPKRPLDKRCRICGDRALGYNFNVVSCESCKAFFRRNALKRKEFRCAYDDNCNVSTSSRRFCQKCRLKKCFDEGMEKDMITPESSKLPKKRKKEFLAADLSDSIKVQRVSPCPKEPIGSGKINQETNQPDTSNSNDNNRLPIVSNGNNLIIPKNALMNFLLGNKSTTGSSIKGKCTCECTCGASPADTSLQIPKFDKCIETEQDASLNYNQLQNFSMDSYPSFAYMYPDESQCQNKSYYNLKSNPAFAASFSNNVGVQPTNNSNMPFMRDFESNSEKILQTGSERQFPKNEYSSFMNETQKALLDELLAANSVMNEPMENFISDEQKNSGSLTDFVNLMDIATRRFIIMAKRLKGFSGLCQEDQIALLKGGWVELMILRGVMSFDPEKDSWLGPKSHQIKVEPVKGLKSGIYDAYKKYFHAFDHKLRSNETVMLILGAVTLFMPDRVNVANKDQIRQEQLKYVDLLETYLHSTQSETEARVSFEHLTRNIDYLRLVRQKVVSIFTLVNPEEIKPLLLEMFDLK